LLFRLVEAEDGIEVTATVIDELGNSVSEEWRDLAKTDRLPPIPDLATASTEEMDQLGEQLRALLSGGELAQVWRQEVDQLVLDPRSEALAALPWEFLAAAGESPPFARSDRPAVRALTPYRDAPGALSVPINVLIVIGDDQDKGVDAQREVDAIYRGLRGAPCCWHVEVIVRPSQQQLRDKFAEVLPQVFHFVGHGRTTESGAALRIVADAGEWDLDARFVARALGKKGDLRLVVLNACRTAAQSAAVRGLADSFLAQAPAVVSTQGDVTSSAAIMFAQRMYRELACGQSVDVAVATARDSIQFTQGLPASAWGLPVLKVACEPAAIMRHDRRWQLREVIIKYYELAEVLTLVDRSAVRRAVHRRDSGLLLVTGDPKAGKSMVLRSYLLTKLVGGASAVYLSMEGRGEVSTDDFVKEVVRQARRWLDPWAEEICDETLKELSGAASGPAMLDIRPADAFQAVDPRYKKLQALLTTLARPAPLVLVLDNLGRVEQLKLLFDGLLVPAATRQLPGVQVIVAIEPRDLRGLVADEVLLEQSIPVRPFQAENVVVLTRELVARSMPDIVDDETQAGWRTFDARMMEWAERRAAERGPELWPADLKAERDRILRDEGLLWAT
jgi:hypothetical protein